MPRMKVPSHPNIWAWPCACSHAGDKLVTVWSALIASRFQTPRNVPGSSKNNRPATM
ncbi:MAG: hypothetical protein WBY44_02595 [Bryobacteraceae bacterium]